MVKDVKNFKKGINHDQSKSVRIFEKYNFVQQMVKKIAVKILTVRYMKDSEPFKKIIVNWCFLS